MPASFTNLPPAVRVNDPLTVVIFGGTGDLTRRKLLPGLFALHAEGLLPAQWAIVAVGRRDHDDAGFRAMMADELKRFSRVKTTDETQAAFLARVTYFKGDLDDPAAFARLKTTLDDTALFPPNRVFYLSTEPGYFGPIIASLDANGLISDPQRPPWTRVVIEKPFGRDLASATALSAHVLHLLDESQVYRIDHYLGKETVQNILSFRFANTIFEPVFNSRYVDHIQVTASETVGMESGRGAYYDNAGALRDMLQNHLLQLLCLVAMEPPSGLAADAVRNEKVKILQSIRPPDMNHSAPEVVRAQYASTLADGVRIPAYVNEDRVDPRSRTESFVAMRLQIESWRWAGVPMFLRTGKRLKEKRTSISVHFKTPPLKLFQTVQCEGDVCDLADTRPNVLTFHIMPNPGITLHFAAKRPAMQLVVEDTLMDFRYAEAWSRELPEAYERLLLDVMRGDSTLFTRSDEVDAAWRIVDPVLHAWQNNPLVPLHLYEPGSWGPQSADQLFTKSHQRWVND